MVNWYELSSHVGFNPCMHVAAVTQPPKQLTDGGKILIIGLKKLISIYALIINTF